MSAPIPAAPTPVTDPATPPAGTQAPAAAVPAEPATPPAKKSLEDSLAALDPDTRKFVLGEVSDARGEAKNLRERLKEAEPVVAEWQRLQEASKTELEKAQEAAGKAAERATALVSRAITAEVKALAADSFADPSDAHAFLELGKYANEDGDVDTEAIQADLADLLARKPHLAKATGPRVPAPNPALGASASGAPDADALVAEAKKKGDWQTVIALENQKLTAAAAKLR